VLFNCIFLLSQITYITFTAQKLHYIFHQVFFSSDLHLGMRSGRNRGLRRVCLYTQTTSARGQHRTICRFSERPESDLPRQSFNLAESSSEDFQCCADNSSMCSSPNIPWFQRRFMEGARRGKIASGRIRWKSHFHAKPKYRN